LKNADAMLKGIINMVDTSGDGKIQYEGGLMLGGGRARRGAGCKS
jgi:hypothetical protein